MIDPRWRKVLKDVFSNKVRTLLVVLSIAVGVFAVGFVGNSYFIVANDMNADYMKANPHAAVIYSFQFDDEIVAKISKVPDVAGAEGRFQTSGRIKGPQGDWIPVAVALVPDPTERKIDMLRPLQGEELPNKIKNKEILLEKSIQTVMKVNVGDTVKIESYDKRVRELKVAGFVRDVTVNAANFGGSGTGYVSGETMTWLGGIDGYTSLVFTVEGDARNEIYVREVAGRVSKELEKSGYQVFATVVYNPGQHPASSIISSLMAMMAFLGMLSVFMSGFLVVNTVNAQISQHIRQIGVMKAIGARSGQIVAMYMVLVLAYGVMALLVALPLAAVVTVVVMTGMSEMLNYQPQPFRIPPVSLILQLLVALLLPVLAALWPVRSGARTTVREAISNYGLGAGTFGKGLIDRLVETVRFLPRPLLISLRNTFRRKGRLMLTLSTLTLAGAIFISVMNLNGAFDVTLAETLGYFLSDLNLSLNSVQRAEHVEEIAMKVPGVRHVEAWSVSSAKILKPGTDTSTEVAIWAPPSGSTMIKPVMTEGRWLLPEDENALVIGNHLINLRPELKVGDEIISDINGREYTWKIVGICKMAGTFIPPFVYTNFEYLTRITGQPGRTSEYRLLTDSQDAAFEKKVAGQLEQAFTGNGIAVGMVTTGAENQEQQSTGINILVYFLMAMAILIAVVGGLGLMGTMSMNVLERTREVGVMRSIGASNGSIVLIVVFEGMLIGMISWALGALLSVPISALLSATVGIAFLFVPMPMVISPDGFIIWLVIVTVISALASVLPALNAARLTVRDVLAYE